MSKQGILLSIAQDQQGSAPTIVTRQNPLPITEYETDIARKKVDGAYAVSIFGSMNVEAGVETIVSEQGMPPTMTVPDSVQLVISSSEVGDIGQVRIVYLDGNLNSQTETITLTGLTPVLSVATDVRALNDAYRVDQASSGTITISGGGSTRAIIPEGATRFNSTLQRVPSGKRMLITGFVVGSISGSAAARVLMKLETTDINGDTIFQDVGVFIPISGVSTQDNSLSTANFTPIRIGSGEWVSVTAFSDKAATVTASIFGWIENDD